MTRFAVVSTYHTKHWDKYAKEFIDSLYAKWPHTVAMRIYVEGGVGPLPDHFDTRTVEASVPKCLEFIERNKGHKRPHPAGDLYLWDACQFAYKPFVVHHATVTDPIKAEKVIWLDADTLTHEVVTEDWLESLQKDGDYLSYLGRQHPHCESGFLMFDITHPYHKEFMERALYWYTSDSIFKLKRGWTDCHVWDMVRSQMEAESKNGQPKISCTNLSPRAPADHPGRVKHVFINSRLGERMDHKKGRRKSKSGWANRLPRDLWVKRSEPYWQR